MTGDRVDWPAAAEAVAAVVDPITTARLDGRVADRILDAVDHGDCALAESWWVMEGGYVAGDVADGLGYTDHDATLLAEAAMIVTFITETPLTYDTVADLALNAAEWHLNKETESCPTTTVTTSESRTPSSEVSSGRKPSSPLAALAESWKCPSSRRRGRSTV